MTDLLHTIPDFPTKSYTHLLPSLEKHHITTADLLTLDAGEIARRAQVPLLDVRRLTGHVVGVLGGELGLGSAVGVDAADPGPTHVPAADAAVPTSDPTSAPARGGAGLRKSGREIILDQQWRVISTLDDSIDAALGGGIPTGYITEFTGESGTGKTQFLLTLLLSAQLPAPHGLSRPTLYISTEHPLPTSRLTQLLATHPRLLADQYSSPPSLARILTLQTPDLESQDHILTYQLPVALARHKIGLCIIDSIAANYRAERPDGQLLDHSPSALTYRSTQLIRLGTLLRSLARIHDCAIVVANQVSDRFPPASLRTSHLTPPPPPSASSSREPFHQTSSPLLSLDHQQRFFTGWGADPSSPNTQLKTPSLGPVWTNQIACRIALIKQQQYQAGTDRIVAPPPHPDEMSRLQGSAGRNAVIETGVGVDIDDEGRIMVMMMRGRKTETKTTTTTKRWMRVVFAPWVKGTDEEDRGVEFEIWGGGVRAIQKGKGKGNANADGNENENDIKTQST